MKQWLLDRYNDEAKFAATMRAVASGIGAMFAFDIIPTGVPGLGPKIGAVLNILAFGTAAGNKTPEPKP